MSALRNRFLNARGKLQVQLQLRAPLLYGFLRKVRGDHFQVLSFEYPVSNRIARYGHGAPPHPELLRLIESRREQYRDEIADILALIQSLRAVPEHAPHSPTEPYWRNAWFSGNDALTLYGFLAKYKPATLLEIGSGNSTKFARRAIADYGLPTQVVSIDPKPRADIDAMCDRVVRAGLETVDLQVFRDLQPGDFLSFDGSHRSFMNTDVTAFFLDVLPIVPAGVHIHVHDIFLPYDYPPGTPYFNEQYLLAVYLMSERQARIDMPNAFVALDADLNAGLRAFWRECGLDQHLFDGNSFWFSKTAE